MKSTETQESKIIEPVYQAKEYQKQEQQEPQQPEPSAPPAEEVTQQPEPSAAPAAETPQPHLHPKPRRHQAGPGFEVSNIYYDEPDFMRNKGFMYGVSGDYTYHPDNFMFRLDGRFSSGNVDYWSSGTGTAAGIRDYNFETRFSFGYDIRTTSGNPAFTPFVGLGYRYLFDGLSAVGPGGHDRKSNYLYSPLGMEAVFRLKGRWSLGLVGEYDLFWHGWQYSETGDLLVVPDLLMLPDFVAKNDQDGGWGARGSVRLTRNLGRIDFLCEPYFRYWSIDASDTFELLSPYFFFSLREPANTTTEWGLRIGIRF